MSCHRQMDLPRSQELDARSAGEPGKYLPEIGVQ